MKLKDKVALITGASRGIGRATALLFAREGAKIIVNYVKAEKEADQVVKEIKKIGSGAIAIKCDVSKEDQVKLMVEKAIKKFGRIDILVNNAGIVFDLPFEERTVEHWKRTLDVNLIGTFICTKYASKFMKNGRIINISSTNGSVCVDPGSLDYGASKAAVIALTRTMAMQLAPDILVNAVAPGWVDTDMNKNLPKDYLANEMKKIYLKRMAKPEEIANIILFLASDEASYLTGATITADAGYQ